MSKDLPEPPPEPEFIDEAMPPPDKRKNVKKSAQ
jgi:hypothetical protein